MLTQVTLNTGALVLIVVGLILFPLPIPLGAVLILSGVALSISVNPNTRAWVLRFRRANPWLEARIDAIKVHLPRFMRRPIDESDPDGTPPRS